MHVKLVLVFAMVGALQPLMLRAQRIESGTGYWYDGVVTHGVGKATVTSDEPRPLRQAVQALAEEYGWTVDYEDPGYSDADAIKRSDPGFTASHPREIQHVVAGHRFESEFTEDANTRSSNSEEKAVLQKVVADYNRSGNPGKFSLLDEGGGRFAVIGSASSTAESALSILDFPITVDIRGTNGSWALGKFCEILTISSGKQVMPMQYPLNVLVRTQVNLRAENEPAREVLRMLLAQAPQKLAWSVLYDIDDKVYYLNLVPVVRAVISPSGQREREWVR